MKLDQPSAWDKLVDFMSVLPKKAATGLSESLSKASKDIFFNKPKDETTETVKDIKPDEVIPQDSPVPTGIQQKKIETRQEIKQSEASPKDVSDSTVKLNKAKQIELNKEIAQAKANAKKSTNKDINENNSNKLSNDTTVPDGDSKIDIAPYVPPV